MKVKLPEFLDTIIYTELRNLLLIGFLGLVFLVDGITHYTDLTKYDGIPQEQLVSIEGFLEECRLVKPRGSDYISVKLDNGESYVIGGVFYKYHDWDSFLEKCQYGDKLRLLVWPQNRITYTLYDIIEIDCNGEIYQSFEGANQIYQSYQEREIPLAKTMIISGGIDVFLILIVLVLRKIL